MRRNLYGWMLTAVVFVLSSGLVWASGGGGEEVAPHGVPLSYALVWLGLLFVMAVGGFAYRGRQRHEPASAGGPGGIVPVLLMLVVGLLFLTESLSAVAHYHEPGLLAAVRFLIKMGTGVLLMFYGLSFMHEH